jgi:hypothetical protein
MLMRAGIPTLGSGDHTLGTAPHFVVANRKGAAKLLMRLGHELSGQMGPGRGLRTSQPLLRDASCNTAAVSKPALQALYAATGQLLISIKARVSPGGIRFIASGVDLECDGPSTNSSEI